MAVLQTREAAASICLAIAGPHTTQYSSRTGTLTARAVSVLGNRSAVVALHNQQ